MITDLELRIRIILKAFEIAAIVSAPQFDKMNMEADVEIQGIRDYAEFMADEIADAIATWTELGIDLEES